jgi:hypothetical protein
LGWLPELWPLHRRIGMQDKALKLDLRHLHDALMLTTMFERMEVERRTHSTLTLSICSVRGRNERE